MKVDTRMGMCNNSPAKASSSENERRSRVLLTPSLLRYVDRGGGTLRRAARSRLRLSHVEGYQGVPSSNPSFGGEEERCTDTVLAKSWADAPLRADLGCSSSYSSEKAKALNLLENRSVEKDFLPTAVVQE